MKIFALIVTHNRLKFLTQTIEAVKSQSSKLSQIIIYNNNSTDGTSYYLNSIKDNFISPVDSPSNTGGAGGFHQGIRKAYEMGADWIWVMDDDCIPEPDALDKLISSPFFENNKQGYDTGYLASRVDWIDGTRNLMNLVEPVFPWNKFHGKYNNVYEISNSTFVSMLINRKAIKKIGLPVKEFFIWGDDWEYSGRISEQFKCYYVSDSVVLHQTATNIGSSVADISKNNFWKYRYDARNSAAMRKKGFSGFIIHFHNLSSKLKLMIRNKVKIRYILGYLYHSFKGLFFNYRKKIEYINDK